MPGGGDRVVARRRALPQRRVLRLCAPGTGRLRDRHAHAPRPLVGGRARRVVLDWDDVCASPDPHVAAVDFARSAFGTPAQCANGILRSPPPPRDTTARRMKRGGPSGERVAKGWREPHAHARSGVSAGGVCGRLGRLRRREDNRGQRGRQGGDDGAGDGVESEMHHGGNDGGRRRAPGRAPTSRGPRQSPSKATPNAPGMRAYALCRLGIAAYGFASEAMRPEWWLTAASLRVSVNPELEPSLPRWRRRVEEVADQADRIGGDDRVSDRRVCTARCDAGMPRAAGTRT